MAQQDWKKYWVTFAITVAIFGTAFIISDHFNNRRIAELRDIEDKISLDILSSETQFDLLKEVPCTQINESILSQELNDLSARLGYMEENLGVTNDEVQRLKKYYSLLQVKDYILMQNLRDHCQVKPVSIIYFYSNIEGECADCRKAGTVLTYLREQYPELRIYAFDYDLDISTIKTLTSIYKVKKELPALIVNDKVYYGFQDLEAMEKIIPNLESLKATSTAATSSATTTKKR
jgi:hypothetical protein